MKINKFVSIFTLLLSLSNFATADLTTGLVAYYPFNKNANDESGNGNHGIVNGATLTTDRFGKANNAYSFDGTSNYIDVGMLPKLGNNPTELTECAWVLSNTSQQDNVILTKRQVEKNGWSTLELYNGYACLTLDNSGYRNNITSTILVNDNAWHFICGTKENSLYTVYLDGVVAGQGNDTKGVGSEYNMTIGYHGAWGKYFNGKIDDIRIYNRSLSASDIQQLYKSPTISSFTVIPKAGNPPLDVNFVATANDPDGSIAAYQWAFGDGYTQITTTGKTSHTYNDLGKFNAGVTIVDNQGAQVKSSLIPIIVKHGMDLVGEVKKYIFDQETNSINIDFKVTNVGDISANKFPVTFNLSANGKSISSTFKSLTIDKLGVGESQILNVDYTFNESIYGKYVLILVDPMKKAAEVDETNNGTRIVIQPMATK